MIPLFILATSVPCVEMRESWLIEARERSSLQLDFPVENHKRPKWK